MIHSDHEFITWSWCAGRTILDIAGRSPVITLSNNPATWCPVQR